MAARSWGWVLLAACGSDVRTAPDAPSKAPSPYVQPRLVSVGDASSIDYGPDGFPTSMTALYSSYTFSWDAEKLVSATAKFKAFELDNTVTAAFTYADGRLSEMRSTCVGTCEGARVDTFAYDSHGSLIAWSTTGKQQAETRSYTYDAYGRLSTVTAPYENSDIEYGLGDGCPTRDRTQSFSYQYTFGRLVRFTGYPVVYDNVGRIHQFESTGPAFHDLEYVDGEARGISVWPGFYNGGYPYGWPSRGELFRLDGTCDPTLSSQPVILGLAVGSLL